MLKFGKLAVVAMAIFALVLGVTSCKKATEEAKDAEATVEEAKDKVEKTAETVEKAAKDDKDVIKK